MMYVFGFRFAPSRRSRLVSWTISSMLRTLNTCREFPDGWRQSWTSRSVPPDFLIKRGMNALNYTIHQFWLCLAFCFADWHEFHNGWWRCEAFSKLIRHTHWVLERCCIFYNAVDVWHRQLSDRQWTSRNISMSSMRHRNTLLHST